jgi:hypothetical protein
LNWPSSSSLRKSFSTRTHAPRTWGPVLKQTDTATGHRGAQRFAPVFALCPAVANSPLRTGYLVLVLPRSGAVTYIVHPERPRSSEGG